MPYQKLLDAFVRSQPGAQGALLLDSEGELVVEAGARDYRHRLIGAYQGIALATAQKTATRYAAGQVRCIHCRYSWGHVVLRPLKDGYYFVFSLAPSARIADAIEVSGEVQDELNVHL